MTQRTALADVTLWRADVSDKTVWLLLRLRDGAGREGWGEATSFGNEAEITGLVAQNGIAGNWFWWSLAFNTL